MANAYFDFGAHHGDGLRQMTKILGIDGEWEIFLFEPNPFAKTLEHLKDYPHEFSFYQKAVWSVTKKIDFYPQAMVDNRCAVVQTPAGPRLEPIFDGMGSAVVDAGSCEPGIGGMRIAVDAISICEAISLTQAENICIKMDIEGSEYTVLPELLRSEHVSRIGRLYVEWHRLSDGTHHEKMNSVKAYSQISIHDWH